MSPSWSQFCTLGETVTVHELPRWEMLQFTSSFAVLSELYKGHLLLLFLFFFTSIMDTVFSVYTWRTLRLYYWDPSSYSRPPPEGAASLLPAAMGSCKCRRIIGSSQNHKYIWSDWLMKKLLADGSCNFIFFFFFPAFLLMQLQRTWGGNKAFLCHHSSSVQWNVTWWYKRCSRHFRRLMGISCSPRVRGTDAELLWWRTDLMYI